ncbi:MAG: UPF0149 family protein [Gammaproteobacteria bacterium]|nr:UPF0149 family protein [Gammaproteobacteria bacterium]
MEDLTELLVLTSIALPEWELHGLSVGVVVGMQVEDPIAAARLIDELRPGLCVPSRLTELCTSVHNQVCATDLSFHPLLPDDEMPIETRLEALGEWVGAFLEGFGALKHPDNEQIDEALADFGEISKVDSNVENTPDAESSYIDVVEFVRVGTMLIHGIVQQDKD